MQPYAVLALLPVQALVLAAPQDPTITAAPSGSSADESQFCQTATGMASFSCQLIEEGFDVAAASYFDSVQFDPALSGIINDVLTQAALLMPLFDAEQTIFESQSAASTSDNSFLADLFDTIVAEHLSEVTFSTGGDAVSSVLAEVQALQESGSAPTPTDGTAVATELPMTAPTGSTERIPGATGSTGATGPAASAAATSPSKATAPRQTELGIMAGVFIGMAGMVLAL